MSVHDMKPPVLIGPEEWEAMQEEVRQLRFEINLHAEGLFRALAELRYLRGKVSPDE